MGKSINGLKKKEEVNQIREKGIISHEGNGSNSNKTNGEIEAQKEDSKAAVNSHRNADQSSTEKVQIHWSTSDQTENAPTVYGFGNEVLSLQNLLGWRENDNEFKAIGIVGMRGVGKTTLCQQLFNSSEMKIDYLPRIWINMSKKPKIEIENDTKLATVKRLLESLGVEGEKIIKSSKTPENDKLKALLYVLHQQLMGKKYLIVLDDVRESEDWYKDLDSWANNSEELGSCLGHGLPKGYGGTVIVTSRDEEVVKKLVGKEKNMHRLKPFSDCESFWSIFRAAVEENGEKHFPDNLEKRKEQVLKKCDGVPLAAKTMGKAMCSRFRAKEATEISS